MALQKEWEQLQIHLLAQIVDNLSRLQLQLREWWTHVDASQKHSLQRILRRIEKGVSGDRRCFPA